ncbi:hypothetical protein pdam_00024775 [Pocillopora damicornis]|uniref:Uncharacterized protein n=1 Tax=Pocillopora damicornis TaxID=46731 RepID=A0A3M6UL29_POCDA|nr:hypothetical protein pdam_00024775 [Pocillopora damicornis]
MAPMVCLRAFTSSSLCTEPYVPLSRRRDHKGGLKSYNVLVVYKLASFCFCFKIPKNLEPGCAENGLKSHNMLVVDKLASFCFCFKIPKNLEPGCAENEGTGLAFVNRNLYDQLGRILAHSTLGKDKIR